MTNENTCLIYLKLSPNSYCYYYTHNALNRDMFDTANNKKYNSHIVLYSCRVPLKILMLSQSRLQKHLWLEQFRNENWWGWMTDMMSITTELCMGIFYCFLWDWQLPALHVIKQCICDKQQSLTHWGRVTHICVGKRIIIGSDNGLSPDRRQAII